MGQTKIEWAEYSWNPVTGCMPCSEGCSRCYAAGIAARFWGDRPFSDVRCHPDRLDQPLRWKKPKMIFVVSMGDLFHEDVPERFIGRVFGHMAAAWWHTFLVLTKRVDRMAEFSHAIAYYPKGDENQRPFSGWPPNVWLGATGENQKRLDERKFFLQIPAAKHFVSLEPLLGPIDLGMSGIRGTLEADTPDWVITGCESGPRRRPTHIDWIRNLRDQCVDAEIPFFLKQMEVDGKVVHMPELDGRRWVEVPK